MTGLEAQIQALAGERQELLRSHDKIEARLALIEDDLASRRGGLDRDLERAEHDRTAARRVALFHELEAHRADALSALSTVDVELAAVVERIQAAEAELVEARTAAKARAAAAFVPVELEADRVVHELEAVLADVGEATTIAGRWPTPNGRRPDFAKRFEALVGIFGRRGWAGFSRPAATPGAAALADAEAHGHIAAGEHLTTDQRAAE